MRPYDQAPHFVSYNRGAVLTQLRVLSLRLSFGGDLSGGARGALRACMSQYFEISGW